jgi:SMI1 / KNR4 family (SUKH-1)
MQWLETVKNLDWGCFDIRPPASHDEISDLEKHLDFSLPDDLREFYCVANGLYGDNNGWEFQIIASIQDVIRNIKSIEVGFYKPVVERSHIILYDKKFRSKNIIPITDGDNSVGVAEFYYPRSNTDSDLNISKFGIYSHKLSSPKQKRDSEITFQAENVNEYIHKFFGIESQEESQDE